MYIESGLFWGFVILAIVTISIMYTTLNNKIFQQRLENEELLKKIAKSKNVTEKTTTEDIEALKEQMTDVLDDLSFAYLILSTIVDNSNNTIKSKIEVLIRRRDKKTKGKK